MAHVSAGPALHSATSLERQVLVAPQWTLWGSLLFVATIFAARRISGGLVEPLSGAGLISMAAVLALAAAAVRATWPGAGISLLSAQHAVLSTELWNSAIDRRRLVAPLAFFAVPGISTIVLLAAVTVSGSSLAGSLTAWLVLIGAEATTWRMLFRRPIRTSLPATDASEDAEEAEFPLGLVQQVTRVLNDVGGESIHAVLRAAIPAGDRYAAIHVAFCPPLDGAPELTAHALENAADVQVTQAESYGARVEVRLPEPAAADDAVLVELIGSVKAAQSA